jgi:hypothetical protein
MTCLASKTLAGTSLVKLRIEQSENGGLQREAGGCLRACTVSPPPGTA